jgi:hypothetical protein
MTALSPALITLFNNVVAQTRKRGSLPNVPSQDGLL